MIVKIRLKVKSQEHQYSLILAYNKNNWKNYVLYLLRGTSNILKGYTDVIVISYQIKW